MGLALGALTIASVSVARADDAGCCEVECHGSDGAGRGMHSMQRRDMTQAACESSFPDCDAKWEAGSCDSDRGGARGVIQGGEVRGGGADEE